jgi:hypothetical protein
MSRNECLDRFCRYTSLACSSGDRGVTLEDDAIRAKAGESRLERTQGVPLQRYDYAMRPGLV